jgi:hypothetical protein
LCLRVCFKLRLDGKDVSVLKTMFDALPPTAQKIDATVIASATLPSTGGPSDELSSSTSGLRDSVVVKVTTL